ncbi:hypothetical protein ACQQ2N_03180 [Dokdonella sp. MW10]|uniref:hypothetical protein n=1 Tax=Dokdonella sp. MW10 TaxID=2992926 RepID=UPI003F7DB5F6
MKSIVVAAVLLLGSTMVLAEDPPEFQPFPQARISVAQWEAYRQQVHGAYGASLRQFPEEHLEVLRSPDNVMHVAFTTAGHAAHPAWVTRSVHSGKVNQIGYFAGSEAPFAVMFQAYRDLTRRSIDAIPDEPAGRKSAEIDGEPGT